jgi:hypothetical protein
VSRLHGAAAPFVSNVGVSLSQIRQSAQPAVKRKMNVRFSLSVAITPVALEIDNFAAGLKAMVPT